MAFRKNINDLNGLIILVVLTLPSIAANVDCNGKPFYCVNTTHFMICVDLGSGISSTIDDFVIPCPPTTVCRGTNHFECEFPTITIATTVASTSQDAASVGIDTSELTTSIPFEEYYDTVSTTTSFENILTQQTIVTEPVTVNEVTENMNVITLRSESNSTLSKTTNDIKEAVLFNPATHTPSNDSLSDTTTESVLNITENVTVATTESRSNTTLEKRVLSTIDELQNNPNPVYTSSTTVSSAITLDTRIVKNSILSVKKNISNTITALQNDPNPNSISSPTVLPAITIDTSNETILTVENNTSSKIGAPQSGPDPIKTSSSTVQPATTLDISNETMLTVGKNTSNSIAAPQSGLDYVNTSSTTVLPAITLNTDNETILVEEKKPLIMFTALQNDPNSNSTSSPTVVPDIILDTGNETILTIGKNTSSTIAAPQIDPNLINTFTNTSTTVQSTTTLDISNETMLTVGKNTSNSIAAPQSGLDYVNTSSTTVLPAITLDTDNEIILVEEKKPLIMFTALQNDPNSNSTSSPTVVPNIILDTGNETILTIGKNTSSTIAAPQNDPNLINTFTNTSTTVPSATTLDISNETMLTVGKNTSNSIAAPQSVLDYIYTSSTTVPPAITLDTDNDNILSVGKYLLSTITVLHIGLNLTNTFSTTVLPAVTLDTDEETILAEGKKSLVTISTLQNDPNSDSTSSPILLPAILLDTGNETILTMGKNTLSKIAAPQNGPDLINTSSTTVLPAMTLDTDKDTISAEGKKSAITIAALQNDPHSTNTTSTTVLPTITLGIGNATLLTSEKYTLSSIIIAALRNDSNSNNTLIPIVLPANTLNTGNDTILNVETNTLTTIATLQNGTATDPTNTSSALLPVITLDPANKTIFERKNISSTIAALHDDQNQINTSNIALSSALTPEHNTTLYTASNTILSDSVADIVTESIIHTDNNDVITSYSGTVSKDLIESIDSASEYYSTKNDHSSTFRNTDALLNETLKLAIIESKVNNTLRDDVPTTHVNAVHNNFTTPSDINNASLLRDVKVMTSESDTTFLHKINTNQTNATIKLNTNIDPGKTAKVIQNEIKSIITQPVEQALDSKQVPSVISPVAIIIKTASNHTPTVPGHELDYATNSNFTGNTLETNKTNYIAINDDAFNAHTADDTSNTNTDSPGFTVFMTELNETEAITTLSTHSSVNSINETTFETENITKSTIASFIEPTNKRISLSEAATQKLGNDDNINGIDIIEIASNRTLQGTLHGTATHDDLNFFLSNISKENKTSKMAVADYAILNTQINNSTFIINSDPGVTDIVTENKTKEIIAPLTDKIIEIYRAPAVLTATETSTAPATVFILNKYSDFDNTAIVSVNTTESIMDSSESYQNNQSTTTEKPAVLDNVIQHKISNRDYTTRPFDNELLLTKSLQEVSTTYTFDITENNLVTTEYAKRNSTKPIKSAETINDTTDRPLISKLASKVTSTSTVPVTESAYVSANVLLNPTATIQAPTVQDILKGVIVTENDNTESKAITSTAKNVVHVINKSFDFYNRNVPVPPILNTNSSIIRNFTERSMLVNPIIVVSTTTNEKPPINVESTISKFELTQPTDHSLLLSNLLKKTQTKSDFLANTTTSNPITGIPEHNLSSTATPNISITSNHQKIFNTISNKQPFNVESVKGKSGMEFIITQTINSNNLRPEIQTLSNVISNNIKTSPPPMGEPEIKLRFDTNGNILNQTNFYMNETLIAQEILVRQTNTSIKPNHSVDIARDNLLPNKNIQKSIPDIYFAPDSQAAIHSSLNISKVESHTTIRSDVSTTNSRAVSEMWKATADTDSSIKSISSILKDVKPLLIPKQNSQPSQTKTHFVNQQNNISGNSLLAFDVEIIDIPEQVISQKTAPTTTSISSPSQLDANFILLDVKPIHASTHSWTPVISKPSEKTDFKSEQSEKEVDDEKPETKNEAEQLSEEKSDLNIAEQNKVAPPTNTVGSNFNQNTRSRSKGTAADVTLPNTNQKRLDTTIEFTTRKMEEKSETQSITNIEQISSTTSTQIDLIRVDNTTPSNQNVSADTRTSKVVKGTLRNIPQTVTLLTKKHNTVPMSESAKPNSTNYTCEPNSRGRFSDSKDCRKFYICIGRPEPIEGICPNKTVFSELWKQCTKNLSHCVRHQQFQCTSEGRFSDCLKDNIYYICVKNNKEHFIRFRLQCQSGYHLNETSVRCELNTELNKSTSQQSTSDQSMSTSAKSEKLVEQSNAFECIKEGKFPDLIDCRTYYVCSKRGKSQYRQKRKQCDSDEIFHKDKKKCVDADSYDCN